jgi:hypothetical protein
MPPVNVVSITWQISIVEIAGFSNWPSLAFSPSGQATIAYYSSLNSALRFATLSAGGAWELSTVETLSGDCAPTLSFRFNQPAISYHFSPAELRYALNRGQWTITTAGDGGYGNSLAIGPSARPGISFSQKVGGLGYTESGANSSVWVSTNVDGHGSGSFNSLAFNPMGQPAIAYSSSDGHGNDVIKFAVFDGTHWSLETVGPGAGWCTLAFTPAGEPAITYPVSSGSDSSVIYAVSRGGSWNPDTVAISADSPSLAFTPTGEPTISYYSRGGSVNYAVLIDRVWKSFVVEAAGKDQTGQMTGPYTLTRLAMNPITGQPAISYYDRANGAIKCAIGTVSTGAKADVTDVTLRGLGERAERG